MGNLSNAGHTRNFISQCPESYIALDFILSRHAGIMKYNKTCCRGNYMSHQWMPNTELQRDPMVDLAQRT